MCVALSQSMFTMQTGLYKLGAAGHHGYVKLNVIYKFKMAAHEKSAA